MEQLRLSLPSLQFLASHAIVRSLVLMKVDYDYWIRNHEDSLRKCELKADELPLPPATREYVKNVLRGFFIQLRQWIYYYCRHQEVCVKEAAADILCDVHGNVDERGMARHHFEKQHKDKFFREDFRPLCRFLEYFSWHYPDYSNDFVTIIANLQKVKTSPEGPEYRIIDKDLHVVFRFVNRRRVPSAFKALLELKMFSLKISRERKDVLVTYHVYNREYDEDMFRIHVDLLRPSQRLEYVKNVLYWRINVDRIQKLFRFLNVLDPEMRRNSLLRQDIGGFHSTACDFLKCCLMPGYESVFIPMMRFVGLNLDKNHYIELFAAVVHKIGFIGFDRLLLQFWKLVPASTKSEFHKADESHDDYWDKNMTPAMETLSEANRALFEVLFDNMPASPPKKKARHAR